MQALGSYEGGRMLFLGLGTGLGNDARRRGRPDRGWRSATCPTGARRTFEDHVGRAASSRFGKKAWRQVRRRRVQRLKAAMVADYVVIGGGNAKLLELPEGSRRGDNKNAFQGGLRLWQGTGPIRAPVLAHQPAEAEAAPAPLPPADPAEEPPAVVGRPRRLRPHLRSGGVGLAARPECRDLGVAGVDEAAAAIVADRLVATLEGDELGRWPSGRCRRRSARTCKA